jgi:hypothetical protein
VLDFSTRYFCVRVCMAAKAEILIEEENGAMPSTAERRALVDRVAGSPQFARSARLRDFLIYVGHESLKAGVTEIHEQEIGVQVFGRSHSYDRSQDNIVRVNASELRKRIETYFCTEGAGERLVFSIPRGGYKPVFRWRMVETEPTTTQPIVEPIIPDPAATASSEQQKHGWLWIWVAVSSVLAIACVALLWQNHNLKKGTDLWAQEPTVAELWTGIAKAAPQTDIVLPDASLSMSEEILGKSISLSDYLDRNFIHPVNGEEGSPTRQQDLQTIFNHNLVTLGDFHAAQQLLGLTPIASSLHLTLARFYGADSIKRNNVVLIGGKKANPWVRLFDEKLNFSVEYDSAHSQAYVANRNPAAGEQAVYAPVMDRNATSAYSVVAYLPNPSKTGRVIILAGTDSDATGAAAEFLTSEDALRSMRQKFHAETMPYFEVLLKTSRLSGTSFNAEPLAFRVLNFGQ